jgi:ribosomal protein S16
MVVLLSVLAFFNPVAQGAAEKIRLDADRYNYWVEPRCTNLLSVLLKLQKQH